MQKKALVVDNNKVILKLLSHILKTRGFQVLTATDGLTALEILDSYHPDIIFTDLIMPNISGDYLCRIISNKKKYSSTLLVVVSALVIEDNVDFLAFGAHACIAKGPASEMAANIDLIISHVNNGQADLLKGMRLGVENRVQRSISKELLEEKRHLKLIFDNIDNGIIEFSKAELITNCNHFVSRIFNKNILEILSSNIRDLFSNYAYEHVAESLEKFHKNTLTVQSKYPVKVNGRDIVFRFIQMSKGTGTSIMIIRDITEEKKSQDKLSENLEIMEKLVVERTKSYENANKDLQEKIKEQKKMSDELEFIARQWSNTFDTISDFVSVHDKNMRFLRVNKALVDFLNREPEDILGMYCYEVMHNKNEPWPDCPHISAIEQRKTVNFEINDSNIGSPLLVTCSPFLNNDGSLLGTVHIARDISDQRKANNEREQLIKKLKDSLAKVKLLSGFIPICSSCKKIRDDKGYWKQVEEYIRDHSEAEFSHSICPGCVKKLYPEIDYDDD